ncbi:MAG TPA: hypothetical protein VLQ52_06885 [Coriobacteriia bacterium]|nr:hypothetical protein [Coriobacteriia bacterium]
MSDVTEAQAAPNKTMLILLGVIVVLLAAIVVIFFVRGSAEPVATGTGTEAPAATPTMPGAVAPVEFDPATATKVPAGETPEQYVITYFDAVVAGDYATAYNRLPTDKKAASTEAEYAAQLQGYGITTYTIDSATEEADEAEVLATATMPGGAFTYLWTFVADGDGWLVKSRTLPGMGQ